MEIRPEAAEAAFFYSEAAVWEWGSLFELTIDEVSPIELPDNGDDPLPLATLLPPPPVAELSPPPPPLDPPETAPPAVDGAGRVRKRDPRLVCPNYLAGVVPCSCPELDEMAAAAEAEAEAASGTRKRVRTGGAAGTTVARCQVAGCEADISELKGYHKRHRVCLRCANASSVVIDGEHKRYCQQCGRFHRLPDFDEGKRSCRKKLERHNKRRRKTTDSRSTNEGDTEKQEDLLPGSDFCGEPRKETSESASGEIETVVSSKQLDEGILLGSKEGHGFHNGSLPCVRNDESNSMMPLATLFDIRIDEDVTNSRSSFSSTPGIKKSAYSSMCPTDRISFKLYDWNPAEFPRRLRHQIFQWLQNMPVELEGYIRPGCTILTVFIAMPQLMWEKLSEDVTSKLKDLVNAPDSLLLGRDTFLIYLGNTIIQAQKDGTSLMNVKMEQIPRLHYVYPAYFEAGKTLEFVVCGSNLEQPKLRFLVSFAGKYLKYDYYRIGYSGKTNRHHGKGADYGFSSEHELFWIKTSCIDEKVLGPAFVEVDNVSGIPNFIPILIGNRQICSELERLEEGFVDNIKGQNVVTDPGPWMHECIVSEQSSMSALLLDIGWLLKDPSLDQKKASLSSMNIKRMSSLLKFLIKNKLSSVLDVITSHIRNIIDPDGLPERQVTAVDADLMQLHRDVKHARKILNPRCTRHKRPVVKKQKVTLWTSDVAMLSECECTSSALCRPGQICRETLLSQTTISR